MRFTSVSLLLTAAAWHASSAFQTSSWTRATGPLSPTGALAVSRLNDNNEPGTLGGTPQDEEIRIAYAEWRAQHKKGPFNTQRFRNFRSNYMTLMGANTIAIRRAREQGKEPETLMMLNEFGDYSVDEFKKMVREGAPPKPNPQPSPSELDDEDDNSSGFQTFGSLDDLENSVSSVNGDGNASGQGVQDPDSGRIWSVYMDWCRQFKKDVDEDRFEVFKTNYLDIERYSEQSGKTLKLNGFVDLSPEELEAKQPPLNRNPVQQKKPVTTPEVTPTTPWTETPWETTTTLGNPKADRPPPTPATSAPTSYTASSNRVPAVSSDSRPPSEATTPRKPTKSDVSPVDTNGELSSLDSVPSKESSETNKPSTARSVPPPNSEQRSSLDSATKPDEPNPSNPMAKPGVSTMGNTPTKTRWQSSTSYFDNLDNESTFKPAPSSRKAPYRGPDRSVSPQQSNQSPLGNGMSYLDSMSKPNEPAPIDAVINDDVRTTGNIPSTARRQPPAEFSDATAQPKQSTQEPATDKTSSPLVSESDTEVILTPKLTPPSKEEQGKSPSFFGFLQPELKAPSAKSPPPTSQKSQAKQTSVSDSASKAKPAPDAPKSSSSDPYLDAMRNIRESAAANKPPATTSDTSRSSSDQPQNSGQGSYLDSVSKLNEPTPSNPATKPGVSTMGNTSSKTRWQSSTSYFDSQEKVEEPKPEPSTRRAGVENSSDVGRVSPSTSTMPNMNPPSSARNQSANDQLTAQAWPTKVAPSDKKDGSDSVESTSPKPPASQSPSTSRSTPTKEEKEKSSSFFGFLQPDSKNTEASKKDVASSTPSVNQKSQEKQFDSASKAKPTGSDPYLDAMRNIRESTATSKPLETTRDSSQQEAQSPLGSGSSYLDSMSKPSEPAPSNPSTNPGVSTMGNTSSKTRWQSSTSYFDSQEKVEEPKPEPSTRKAPYRGPARSVSPQQSNQSPLGSGMSYLDSMSKPNEPAPINPVTNDDVRTTGNIPSTARRQPPAESSVSAARPKESSASEASTPLVSASDTEAMPAPKLTPPSEEDKERSPSFVGFLQPNMRATGTAKSPKKQTSVPASASKPNESASTTPSSVRPKEPSADKMSSPLDSASDTEAIPTPKISPPSEEDKERSPSFVGFLQPNMRATGTAKSPPPTSQKSPEKQTSVSASASKAKPATPAPTTEQPKSASVKESGASVSKANEPNPNKPSSNQGVSTMGNSSSKSRWESPTSYFDGVDKKTPAKPEPSTKRVGADKASSQTPPPQQKAPSTQSPLGSGASYLDSMAKPSEPTPPVKSSSNQDATDKPSSSLPKKVPVAGSISSKKPSAPVKEEKKGIFASKKPSTPVNEEKKKGPSFFDFLMPKSKDTAVDSKKKSDRSTPSISQKSEEKQKSAPDSVSKPKASTPNTSSSYMDSFSNGGSTQPKATSETADPYLEAMRNFKESAAASKSSTAGSDTSRSSSAQSPNSGQGSYLDSVSKANEPTPNKPSNNQGVSTMRNNTMSKSRWESRISYFASPAKTEPSTKKAATDRAASNAPPQQNAPSSPSALGSGASYLDSMPKQNEPASIKSSSPTDKVPGTGSVQSKIKEEQKKGPSFFDFLQPKTKDAIAKNEDILGSTPATGQQSGNKQTAVSNSAAKSKAQEPLFPPEARKLNDGRVPSMYKSPSISDTVAAKAQTQESMESLPMIGRPMDDPSEADGKGQPVAEQSDSSPSLLNSVSKFFSGSTTGDSTTPSGPTPQQIAMLDREKKRREEEIAKRNREKKRQDEEISKQKRERKQRDAEIEKQRREKKRQEEEIARAARKLTEQQARVRKEQEELAAEKARQLVEEWEEKQLRLARDAVDAARRRVAEEMAAEQARIEALEWQGIQKDLEREIIKEKQRREIQQNIARKVEGRARELSTQPPPPPFAPPLPDESRLPRSSFTNDDEEVKRPSFFGKFISAFSSPADINEIPRKEARSTIVIETVPQEKVWRPFRFFDYSVSQEKLRGQTEPRMTMAVVEDPVPRKGIFSWLFEPSPPKPKKQLSEEEEAPAKESRQGDPKPVLFTLLDPNSGTESTESSESDTSSQDSSTPASSSFSFFGSPTKITTEDEKKSVLIPQKKQRTVSPKQTKSKAPVQDKASTGNSFGSLFGNQTPARKPEKLASPGRPTLNINSKKVSPAQSKKPQKAGLFSSPFGSNPKTEEEVPTISMWKQNPNGSITGFISRTKEYRNGGKITTSPVPKGAKPNTVVATRSGSKYRLSKSTTTYSPYGKPPQRFNTNANKKDTAAGAATTNKAQRGIFFGGGGASNQKTTTPPKTGGTISNAPTLSRWKQNSDGTITGIIRNKVGFDDGTKITTSPVQMGVRRGSVVRTSAGSQYRLV